MMTTKANQIDLVFHDQNQNKSNSICFLTVTKSTKIHLFFLTKTEKIIQKYMQFKGENWWGKIDLK